MEEEEEGAYFDWIEWAYVRVNWSMVKVKVFRETLRHVQMDGTNEFQPLFDASISMYKIYLHVSMIGLN